MSLIHLNTLYSQQVNFHETSTTRSLRSLLDDFAIELLFSFSHLEATFISGSAFIYELAVACVLYFFHTQLFYSLSLSLSLSLSFSLVLFSCVPGTTHFYDQNVLTGTDSLSLPLFLLFFLLALSSLQLTSWQMT